MHVKSKGIYSWDHFLLSVSKGLQNKRSASKMCGIINQCFKTQIIFTTRFNVIIFLKIFIILIRPPPCAAMLILWSRIIAQFHRRS